MVSDRPPRSRSGSFIPTGLRSALDEGSDAFSQAKEEASLDGEVSYVSTGLIVRGGVIGRSPTLGPLLLLEIVAGCFLTGSISPSFRSNNDTKAFVGPIELVSVVRSESATELVEFWSPIFPLRCCPARR